MPRGLRHVALSISFLSPIVRRPDAFAVTKIASLIFRPERRFLALTSFQSLTRPSLSFGSSSLISLRRQSLSLSRARLRPPGNIQSPSRFRLTSSTRPRFAATSFEDFAIPIKHHLSTQPSILFQNPIKNYNQGRLSWRPLSCQRYDGRCGALILPACQMVLDTIGDLLADRGQLKQVFFDDRIVRLLGKFPIRGRLAP